MVCKCKIYMHIIANLKVYWLTYFTWIVMFGHIHVKMQLLIDVKIIIIYKLDFTIEVMESNLKSQIKINVYYNYYIPIWPIINYSINQVTIKF